MRSVVASGLPWFEALESRRAILAKSAEEAEKDSQYIGDPKTHGLDKPRGGGFSIMQNLQKDLHEESQEEAEKAEPRKWERSASELRSRRGMYWCSPDRTYRLTKGEQEGGQATCPKCKAGMELEPYTRSEKMWRCPKCGFKVPSGKAVTQRPQVEVEVEPDGEVEITVSSLKSRREQ
jgi:ribosomal protein L37AE/L43A